MHLPLDDCFKRFAFISITGESVLFFGCRNKAGDDFFRQEWDKIEKDKETPVRIFTCYSRDQVSNNLYLFYVFLKYPSIDLFPKLLKSSFVFTLAAIINFQMITKN